MCGCGCIEGGFFWALCWDLECNGAGNKLEAIIIISSQRMVRWRVYISKGSDKVVATTLPAAQDDGDIRRDGTAELYPRLLLLILCAT